MISSTIRLVPVGCRNHARIETPGICHQSFRIPPRIDDLGSGELSVDSAQDRALAGLLCAGNGVNLVDAGMVLVLGQDAWGVACHRQGIVRGSIWWTGACSVISGVIVSPAVISGAAIGMR